MKEIIAIVYAATSDDVDDKDHAFRACFKGPNLPFLGPILESQKGQIYAVQVLSIVIGLKSFKSHSCARCQ